MGEKLSDRVKLRYPTSPALADSIKGLESDIDSLKGQLDEKTKWVERLTESCFKLQSRTETAETELRMVGDKLDKTHGDLRGIANTVKDIVSEKRDAENRLANVRMLPNEWRVTDDSRFASKREVFAYCANWLDAKLSDFGHVRFSVPDLLKQLTKEQVRELIRACVLIADPLSQELIRKASDVEE